MASVNFGKIVYPLRGQPINCSIVSTIFFSLSLWDGSCSWAHNMINIVLDKGKQDFLLWKQALYFFIYLPIFMMFLQVLPKFEVIYQSLHDSKWSKLTESL